ncbi:putative mitochondrial carnitine O-acetyltransferase [Diutina catenulata]
MSTFSLQDQLQKLPIPPLEETCANYLKVLKPLQTEQEYHDTEEAVAKFLHGVGPYLDSELRKYAETRPSYIEQFWYDSYLNYDSPVVLNLNPFFLLEDDPFNNESTSNPQIKRATSLTVSALKFIQALKNETLAPDTVRGKPLCMYQYSKLFGSARIPTHDGCVMQSDASSNHIIVMSKSQIYWFDVLDSNNNIVLSDSELMVNFTSIIHDSQTTHPADIARSSFGVLTTENRRIWAHARLHQIQPNPVNNEILSIIDSALFVLCLDDVNITDLSELSKNMLCGLSILDKGIQVGTCTNRWYDKMQIIITQNGKAGINFEHTGVDGHTVLRFVSDIYTDSILSFAHSINANAPSLWKEVKKSEEVVDNLVTVPRKLEWDLTPDLSLALRFGETRLSDLINQNEFKHLEFKTYGSTQIKKMKYSPDAFVQMAFQATYYALYGKVECTYEPAMTKNFFHGRTEAIRTVSEESNYFVRKFFDAEVTNKHKLQYLSAACSAHTDQTRRASSGKGVDRHLYGLFCIWKRYVDDADVEIHDSASSNDTVVGHDDKGAPDLKELPEIFANAGWDKLNNTVISTSNCGNPSLRLFGFGPVSANGFGIGYIIKDDSISICVSSKHRQTQRFLVTLESYLTEIQNMWRQVRLEEDAIATQAQMPALARAKTINLSTLLGGYGYFDMGDDDMKSRGHIPEPPFLNRQNSSFSNREIGKKLRLSEY